MSRASKKRSIEENKGFMTEEQEDMSVTQKLAMQKIPIYIPEVLVVDEPEAPPSTDDRHLNTLDKKTDIPGKEASPAASSPTIFHAEQGKKPKSSPIKK